MTDINFEEIKFKLKEEFFGIDKQIDEIVSHLETWYNIKEYQIKPYVVNLWGMTGTGKTALLNRSLELLKLKNKTLYINLLSNSSHIKYDLFDNESRDGVIILDEFQHLRTIDEAGLEIKEDVKEKELKGVVLDLLDSGKLTQATETTYSYIKFQLKNSLVIMNELLKANCEYKNGVFFHNNLQSILYPLGVSMGSLNELNTLKNINVKITDNNLENNNEAVDKALETTIDTLKKKDPIVYSLTETVLDNVLQPYIGNFYDFYLTRDLDLEFPNYTTLYKYMINLSSLNELYNFVDKVYKAKLKLQEADYSKSLLFVVGNLDECYKMANDLNSDLNADFFYKQTLKINILDIREALKTRFRSEQIARLGSIHVIYPSLNKKAFEQIISKELNLFSKTIIEKFNFVNSVNYNKTINELLYKEGVLPLIGARSVFSVISDIITSKFPSIIKKLLTINNTNVLINFNYNKDKKLIEIFYLDLNNNIIDSQLFKYNLKIDNLRKESNKGKQTHRAVHEAGHAVCSIVLEHIFPESIYSIILSNKDAGVNIMNVDDFYYLKKSDLLNNITTLLAGYVAEEIVFGKENVSNGSSSDITKATQTITSVYRECGFGDETIGKTTSNNVISSEFRNTNYSIPDDVNGIKNFTNNVLTKAKALAKETLTNQELLFYKISEYLTKHSKIENKKIKELTKKYIKDIDYNSLLENKQNIYLNLFNEKFKKIIKN